MAVLGTQTSFNHSMGMEDSNHLSVLHTHILALGCFFFLIALALEKIYTLSRQKCKKLKICQQCKNEKSFLLLEERLCLTPLAGHGF